MSSFARFSWVAALSFSVAVGGCDSSEEGAEFSADENPLVVTGCGAPTVANGGFEARKTSMWTTSGQVTAISSAAHTGAWGVQIGKAARSGATHTISQTITVPPASAGRSTLSFWVQPHCAKQPDRLLAELRSANGSTVLATAMDECTSSTAWSRKTFDLAPWAGSKVTLRFSATDDGKAPGAYVYLDDVAVETDAPAPLVAISAPLENSTVQGTVQVTATAQVSACTSLQKIDFAVDGSLIGSATTSPGSASWNASAATPGRHVLTATATDKLGQTQSTGIFIDVAEPCGTAATWSTGSGAALVTTPASAIQRDPVFWPLDRIAGWGRDGQLVLYDLRGKRVIATPSLSGTVSSAPVLAHLTDQSEPWAYVTTGGPSSGGFIYKIDASNGDILASRRIVSNACASDQLFASPLVIPFSRSDLPTLHEVVIVTQKLGCGDHQRNSVLALDPNTLATVWRFNVGELQVDGSEGGCSYEPTRDLLACVTLAEPQSTQNTVWLIRGSDGSLVGAAALGSVRAKPAFHPSRGHLYVSTEDRYPHALNVDDAVQPGVRDWWLKLNDPGPTSTPITGGVVAAPLGPLADVVYTVDSGGLLNAVYDEGDQPGAAIVIWNLDLGLGRSFSSAPALDATDQRLYVGASNGVVEQIGALNGASERSRTIDLSLLSPAVTPTFDFTNGVIGSSRSGFTRRYCRPFP